MKRLSKKLRGIVLVVAVLGALVALRFPSLAFGQMGDDRPIGIQNDTERQLFAQLRCMCGGCARDSLETCTCGYAADRREEVRAMLKSGMSVDEVVAAYVKRFGTDALEVPSNSGANRLIYAVPLGLVVAGAFGVAMFLRHLRKGPPGGPPKASGGGTAGKRDAYDDKLDDELRDLDNDE